MRIEINKAKHAAWKELIETIDTDSWGLPYKVVLSRLRKAKPGITEILTPQVLRETIERLFPIDNFWREGREEMDLVWNDDYNIHVAEVYGIIRKNRKKSTDKAPGKDGIKFKYIKCIPDIMLDKITDCFNVCLQEGKYPRCWKNAVLALIPKGELDLTCPKVRPICLLNELGKILERILVQRLEMWMDEHLESNIAENQFEFRRGRSTYDALYLVRNTILSNTYNGEIVAGASIDITNAFNAIRWKHIITAFKDKGFPEYLRRIISDYLSKRTIEFPDSNGIIQKCEVTSGVPQGSVFEPVLWNIGYDWTLRTPLEESCQIIGYADNTLILASAKNYKSVITKLNLQISKVLYVCEVGTSFFKI